MKKQFKVMFFLLSAFFCFALFGPQNVAAATEYDSIDFEQTMLIGSKQTESGDIYWKMNGVSYVGSTWSDTIVKSSDETVVKASLDWDGLYCVSLEALNPGTATITILFEDAELMFDVTVLGTAQGEIGCCAEDMTIKRNETYEFDMLQSVFFGNIEEYFNITEMIITSSDESVVKVNEYLTSIELEAVGAGTATITVEIDAEGEKIDGITDQFQVTVTEEPKAEKPKILSQTSFKPQVWPNKITCGFKLSEGNIEYEIWCSSNKRKGFKKVAWVKAEDYGQNDYDILRSDDKWGISRSCDFEDTITVTATKYNKKKFKTNKKYYFKMRARYTDSSHCNEWSEWSKVKEYWTSPAKIKDSKIKFSKSTRKVTFPKVKGVKGYSYVAYANEKQGYNIFGKPVYFSVTEIRTTSKRSFKVSTLMYKMKPEQIYNVRPYAKHNGYYYMDGDSITKKLSDFRHKSSDKYASKY